MWQSSRTGLISNLCQKLHHLFLWPTKRIHLLGLCINDLPVHNFSRDSLFANISHSKELEDRINAEMEKIKQIEKSMKRLDVEKKVNDDLLSQMIPKKVMEKINSGKWSFYDTMITSDALKFKPHSTVITTVFGSRTVAHLGNYIFPKNVFWNFSLLLLHMTKL